MVVVVGGGGLGVEAKPIRFYLLNQEGLLSSPAVRLSLSHIFATFVESKEKEAK